MTERARATRRAWVAVLLAALANVLAWGALNPRLPATEAPPRVAGLAYSPYQRHADPRAGARAEEATVAADLALLADLTGRIRTYSAADLPTLPENAAARGLKVTLGAWIDARRDNNARELDALIAQARASRAVERVIVGNETQLHGSLPRAELIALLQRARAALSVPVSTAEPWHVWLADPELARHVDFLTVHLLPYWEGVHADVAVDLALERYGALAARFPDKHVVIGEVGWPSGGETVRDARATPALQAQFVRSFVARAAAQNLDYFVMEAFDQPWKASVEGPAGAHWGMFSAGREAKFDLSGPLESDAFWRGKALIATLLGVALALPLLAGRPRLRTRARFAFALAAQAAASCAVALAAAPLINYLRAGDWVAFALLAPAITLALALVIAQWLEFAELYWPGSLARVTQPAALCAGERAPPIGIHLAACNEPPAQVIAAIESLIALDWPDLDIIVIDNNTTDPSLWQPVEAHVAARNTAAAADMTGRRLRFRHLPRWPGFKAGALNVALAHTDPRVEWIGVIDADYVVERDWLASLAGHFSKAEVAVLQAPQAHRGWRGHALARLMHWEYESFFRIGMHHRHERDAIIQHGTMTLVRACDLRRAGWDEACVCEDTELGLRLLAAGRQVLYVDRVAGSGLTPADLGAWLRQRQRWAEGGMQILRKHWRALVASGSTLHIWQRYHFLAGWLPWLGDAAHLLLTLAALAWSVAALALPGSFGLPVALFAAPLLGLLLPRLLLGPLLHARRVGGGARGAALAALAGMALSHSAARGVLAGLSAGLTGRSAQFGVTRKGRTVTGAPHRLAPVREHAALCAALLIAALAFTLGRPAQDSAALVWVVLLAALALPYAAALAVACMQTRRARQSPPRMHAESSAKGPRRAGSSPAWLTGRRGQLEPR
ncbi:MAG: glycosyltransferase [Burkholderiales bacterium]|nr:glycosyltransferase [Burkholderiales bacterium]